MRCFETNMKWTRDGREMNIEYENSLCTVAISSWTLLITVAPFTRYVLSVICFSSTPRLYMPIL